VRRVLAWGAIVGGLAGLIAQLFVHVPESSGIVPLVLVSLLFPAVIFGVWWLLSPDIAVEPVEDAQPLDSEERLQRIEATFDQTAVPRARRHELDGSSVEERSRFRSSIGIHASTGEQDPASFGVPRPARAVRRSNDA
jgi:hypothetical protein